MLLLLQSYTRCITDGLSRRDEICFVQLWPPCTNKQKRMHEWHPQVLSLLRCQQEFLSVIPYLLDFSAKVHFPSVIPMDTHNTVKSVADIYLEMKTVQSHISPYPLLTFLALRPACRFILAICRRHFQPRHVRFTSSTRSGRLSSSADVSSSTTYIITTAISSTKYASTIIANTISIFIIITNSIVFLTAKILSSAPLFRDK